MTIMVLIVGLLLPWQGMASDTLAATPQGKHVLAYFTAFNASEQAFIDVHDQLMADSVLKKIPREKRIEMFTRMRGDFGTMTIEKVARASAKEIAVVVLTKDGAEGTFTFQFEEAAPFKIASIGIDVRG